MSHRPPVGGLLCRRPQSSEVAAVLQHDSHEAHAAIGVREAKQVGEDLLSVRFAADDEAKVFAC